MTEQTTFGQFSANSAESAESDPFEFDQYGPTSRRPIPDAERAALFECGGELIDRRSVPESGLSLSDITDWPYINREESHPNAREHFENIMSTIHDTDDESTDDEDDGIDAEAYAKANVGRVAPIDTHGDDHAHGTTHAVEDDDPEALTDGGEIDGYVCERCPDETEATERLDDGDTMLCADCYAEAIDTGDERDDRPATDYAPGDEVLLIENPAVGLNTSPSIITAEVSSTGTSVMIPEDQGLSSKRRRLDASEIFGGESEYRDSTSWELYTPGRYRSTQSSNFAPGPQAGSNGKSDIGALPEPTHWPQGDEPDDAPDVCPACGEREAPWKDVGLPRCQRCGETVDPDSDDESGDDGPDKWDLSSLERADCLILEGHRGEFVVTGIHYFRGTHTVNRVDVARRDGSEWNEYTIQKVTRQGEERLKVNTDGTPSVAINVDDPGHARDFEVIDNDEEKLRRYIREGYYGE